MSEDRQSHLATSAKKSWLKFTDQPLPSKLRNILVDEAAAQNFSAVSFTLVEFNLQRAGRLLDNCLEYSREYNDLVVVATRQALEYELFEQTHEAYSILSSVDYDDEQLRRLQDGSSGASKAYRDGEGPLNIGSALLAATSAEIAERRREELAKARNALDGIRAYNEQFIRQVQDLHEQQGSSFDFEGRANGILIVLAHDLRQAYGLLRAAYLQWAAIIKPEVLPEAFPVIIEVDDPLLSLVLFCRAMMLAIEQRRSREIDVEVVTSLAKIKAWPNPIPNGDGAVSSAVDFELDEMSIGFEVQDARLVGFGISLVIGAERLDIDSYAAGARIYFPSDGFVEREPERLSHVCCYRPNRAPAWTASERIYYTKPHGKFRVEFDSDIRSGQSQQPLAWYHVSDVLIHRLVRGLPARKPIRDVRQ